LSIGFTESHVALFGSMLSIPLYGRVFCGEPASTSPENALAQQQKDKGRHHDGEGKRLLHISAHRCLLSHRAGRPQLDVSHADAFKGALFQECFSELN